MAILSCNGMIVSGAGGLVAVQFRVTNTLKNGDMVLKSNCNFFEVQGGKFKRVNVYMAGENTLNAPGSD